MKVLFVGGTFDDYGGKPSSVAKKVAEALHKSGDIALGFFNGGDFKDIEKILETSADCDAVLW